MAADTQTVTVTHLDHPELELTFTGLSPIAAVIAAYAQCEHMDHGFWNYDRRYGVLVTRTEHSVLCGGYVALATPAQIHQPLHEALSILSFCRS